MVFLYFAYPPPPPSLFLWSVSKPGSHWPLKQERRRKRFYVLVLIKETMIETQTNDRQKQSMERTEYSFFSPPLLHPLCFRHLCRSVNRHDGGGEKNKKMNHKNLPQFFKEVWQKTWLETFLLASVSTSVFTSVTSYCETGFRFGFPIIADGANREVNYNVSWCFSKTFMYLRASQ